MALMDISNQKIHLNRPNEKLENIVNLYFNQLTADYQVTAYVGEWIPLQRTQLIDFFLLISQISSAEYYCLILFEMQNELDFVISGKLFSEHVSRLREILTRLIERHERMKNFKYVS